MKPIEPKRFYIARRPQHANPKQFRLRWRQHGQLAMSFMARQNFENVSEYVHFDPLNVAAEGISAVGDYSGVGFIRFVSPEARRRHAEFQEARAALVADEDDCFAARVSLTGLVANEVVIREGAVSDVVRFKFLWRRNDIPAGNSAAIHALMAGVAPSQACRHVLNFPLVPENGLSWGLTCDVVEEIWFQSADALQEAERGPGERDIRALQSQLFEKSITIAARAVVLHDRNGKYPDTARYIPVAARSDRINPG